MEENTPTERWGDEYDRARYAVTRILKAEAAVECVMPMKEHQDTVELGACEFIFDSIFEEARAAEKALKALFDRLEAQNVKRAG